MKGKKLIFAVMLLSVLVLSLMPGTALATVDLTKPLPIEVNDNQAGEIHKIYELPKTVDPNNIPIGDIVVKGITYKVSDVLRTEIAQEDTKEYTQLFEEESKTDDEATLAYVMPPERQVFTDDGYEGTLKIVPDTLRAEATGYNTSKRQVTVKREYPNQASQDLDHLPKTVTEGGREYTLYDVNWRTDNTYNSDDYEIGDRYTAVVTYARDAVSSSAKGFTVTAQYKGTVTRGKDALIRYTVIYMAASEVPATVESEAEQTPPEGTVTFTPGGATAAQESDTAASVSQQQEVPETKTKSSGVGALAVAGIIVGVLVLLGLGFVLIRKYNLFGFGGQKYDWQEESSTDES